MNLQQNIKAPAPIALFTFNRAGHTRWTLESLMANLEFIDSQLFIYCDGARNEAEMGLVEETRQLVRDWPHPNKTIIERDKNWGLANSIITGVTELCERFGQVVVLEDDMVVSPFFLGYMNEALEKYRDDERVISIHGYSFPIEGLPEAFFIKGASCWGWATWKRGWDLFESDGQKLLTALEKNSLLYRFDIDGAKPYRKMLVDQIHGRNNSWAIRWYASALIQQKLTLHPGRSLIYNTGMDGSGTHCDSYGGFDSELSSTPISLDELIVTEDAGAYKAWYRYLKLIRRTKILETLTSFKKLRGIISNRFGANQ